MRKNMNYLWIYIFIREENDQKTKNLSREKRGVKY